MTFPKAMNILMICLSLLASGGYFVAGDFRRAVYWVGSAILISAVTF